MQWGMDSRGGVGERRAAGGEDGERRAAVVWGGE